MRIEDFAFEPLVGLEQAAKFLDFSQEKVRQMARDGLIPCVPFRVSPKRTIWKFRISDLKKHVSMMAKGVNKACRDHSVKSKE